MNCSRCKGPLDDPQYKSCTICREQSAQYMRDYYKQNPGKRKSPETARKDNLRGRHGLTEAELDYMLDEQKWKCLICEEGLTKKNYHIDHDHAKGCCGESRSCPNCRRGILCSRCNTLVGRVETNLPLFDRIFDYIGAQ